MTWNDNEKSQSSTVMKIIRRRAIDLLSIVSHHIVIDYVEINKEKMLEKMGIIIIQQ